MNTSPQPQPTGGEYGAKSARLNDSAADSVKPRKAPVSVVGLERVIHTLQRRVRFLGRFIYWTCKHGSTANAAWVCAMEGYTW